MGFHFELFYPRFFMILTKMVSILRRCSHVPETPRCHWHFGVRCLFFCFWQLFWFRRKFDNIKNNICWLRGVFNTHGVTNRKYWKISAAFYMMPRWQSSFFCHDLGKLVFKDSQIFKTLPIYCETLLYCTRTICTNIFAKSKPYSKMLQYVSKG